MRHNPHVSAKVFGAYFRNRFLKSKGAFTKDIENSICINFVCKVSYWKIRKGSEIAKTLVRKTYEHDCSTIDAYRYHAYDDKFDA